MRITSWVVAGLLSMLHFTISRAQEVWTPVVSPTTSNLWSVCYGGGRFVAVGEGGTILTSPDGLTWTRRISGNALWLVGVGYGNGLYVVVGDQGTILTSPDGISWTSRRTGGTRINAVAFGNGFFLAVDDAGGSWRSPDGVTWTRATGSSFQLRGLVYVEPLFVMTGNYGTIRTTFDGELFTARSDFQNHFLESVAFGRNLFVAVGASGATYTSRETVKWVPQVNGPVYLRGAGFFNNQFVGVGENGSVVTSFDGSAWSPRPTATNQVLTAVGSSENAAIAVGFGGTILRSSPAQHAPAIVSSPAGLVEAAGNNVLFTVRASGTTPLTYQWAFNGTAIAGATRDEMLLTNVQSSAVGQYTAAVTNSLGTVTSAAAVLSIVPSFPEPTSIVDPTFNPSPAPSSAPTTAVEQPDGKILFGGNFVYLVNGVVQTGIARLNVDGSLDSTFLAGVGVSGHVATLALHADGKVLLGGNFTSVAGVPRANLARLNANGSLDTTFAPSGSAATQQIAVQPDGKILRNAPLQRLNTDGSPDMGFNQAVAAIGSVGVFAITPGQKILVSLANPQQYNAYTSLLRLNSDGSRDQTFSAPPFPENISFVGVLPDSRIIVAGQYVVTTGRWYAKRLQSDGALDPSYQQVGGELYRTGVVMAADVDGRLILGHSGVFASGDYRILRYTRDGFPDPTLRYPSIPPSPPAPTTPKVQGPSVIVPLSGGRMLMLGEFSNIDGVPRMRVARTIANNAPAINAPVAPALSAQIVTARAGDTVQIHQPIAGTGPFTNWPPVVLSNVQETRVYDFAVSNRAGTLTLPPVSVVVTPAPPTLVTGLLSASVVTGGTATFSVETKGSEPSSYLWFFNNASIPADPGTPSKLTVRIASAANTGTYTVVVRNGLGSVSSSATLTVVPSSVLSNLSVRTTLAAQQTLIVGAVVNGVQKNILLRAAGPALNKFGLSGMADPRLELYTTGSLPTAANDDWPGSLAPTFSSVGAFPFDPGSKDAALSQSLRGAFTVQARGNSPGVILVEAYDETAGTASRLVNLSARNQVGTGADILIAGFALNGTGTKQVLIRAVGPTLVSFGVTGILADPKLEVFSSSGVSVATNDNWPAALAPMFTQVGAFPLIPGSKDAALLVTLNGGTTYSVQVSGVDGGTGEALIEVYEVL